MTDKKLDALLGAWPTAGRSESDWDDRAADVARAAAQGRSKTGAALPDDALFSAPFPQQPGEGSVSGKMTSPADAGRFAARAPGSLEVEKKMSNPSDRSRDRSSFQDLAKLASTTSVTPPPPAAVPVIRGEEAKKDDSGIVDLKAMAASDPAAEQRAQSTPLAAAGLFEEDAAPSAPKLPPPVAAESAAPAAPSAAAMTGSVPPPSETLASQSVPAPVSAVPAPLAKEGEKKKGGGIIFLFGGIAAIAAIAAGGFFYMRSHKTADTVAKPAPPPPTVTVAAATAPTPSASVALADPTPDDSATPDDPNATKKSMPKFTATGGGTKPTPSAGAGAPDPSSTVDPKLVFNMPQTGGGKAGDLDEEMRKRVGAQKDDPSLKAAATTAAAGNVPQKPSQGQVAGAVNVVLPSARACVNADDPVSRATVVFQSDGTVQSVSVTGFAAGKGAEGCIKGALSKAKVPAFAEPSYAFPVTIRGTN